MRKVIAEPYTVFFMTKHGCEQVVIRDMARYDGATIVTMGRDDGCRPGNMRYALFQPMTRLDATLERWRSFAVGAVVMTGEHMDAFHMHGHVPKGGA